MGVENNGGDGDETKRVADIPFSTCACFNLGERETSSEEEEAGFGGTPGNYHRRLTRDKGPPRRVVASHKERFHLLVQYYSPIGKLFYGSSLEHMFR